MSRIKRAERPAAGVHKGTESNLETKTPSYRERFDRWKVRFADEDYRLPRRPWGEPAIDYNRIAAETGIPAASLSKPPYVGELQRQASKGLQLCGTDVFLPISVGELVFLGKQAVERRERADRNKTALQRKAIVANFTSSCRRLEAFAGDAAKPGLETVQAAISAELAKPRPDSKTLAAWRSLEAILVQFGKDGGLPATFNDALDFIAHRTQWSRTRIAEVVGVEPSIVYNWLYKNIQPRVHHEVGLRKLEASLGLEAAALVDRIQRLRRHDPPKSNESINPDGPLPQGVLRPFLPPGFDKMPKTDKDEAAAEAESFYRRGINPKEAARVRMRRVIFILNTPHADLQSEIAAYLAFYSEANLPYGINRDVKKLWKSGGVTMVRDAVLRFFGYLSSPYCEDFQIPADQLTLAFFAFPQFAHAFVNWRIARAREELGHSTIPRTDLKPVSLGKQMVLAKTGWLTQRGDLASRLVPVASKSKGWILSPTEIAAAQANWHATCEDAEQAYAHQYRSFTPAIHTSRDDHAKVLAILRSDNPQRAFSILIEGLRQEVCMLKRHCPAWRDAVRDLALVHVEARCALREYTLQSLTHRADNTGHVQYDADAHIMIDAPADLFKNGKSSSFFVNKDGSVNRFRRTLDTPVAPCNADIKLYLCDVRPVYAGNSHNDAFLLMRDGGAMSDDDIGNIMRRITKAHLVWNDRTRTGFEGVHRPLPLRFFRHVLATGTWKLSGDVQVAADSIADTVEVTREHYGLYVPEDRRRNVEKYVSVGLAKG